MTASVPRPSILRGLMGTAFLLSVVYLVLGLLVELLYRAYPVPLVEALSRAVDALPAGILRPTGALTRLTEMYLDDRLPKYGLRIVFGVTAVAFFFVTALFVAALTAALRRLFDGPRRA